MNNHNRSQLSMLQRDLRAHANSDKAAFLSRYFKTTPGGYAEGDMLLGVTVPQTRIIAKKYKDLSIQNLHALLTSKYHEERLVALEIVVDQFRRAKGKLEKKRLFDFYLDHTAYVNN